VALTIKAYSFGAGDGEGNGTPAVSVFHCISQNSKLRLNRPFFRVHIAEG
jgi:hypothetical protein